MALIISEASVREYLELNSPGSSSRVSDSTIGSNIRAALSALEKVTERFLGDHPAVTWVATTMNDPLVLLPGFRSFTSVTGGGTGLTVGLPGVAVSNPSVWARLEATPGVPSPLYVGLQFRVYRAGGDGPWYLHDPLWWDKNLDSPYHWGNVSGGTSLPNDLVIVGNGGYAAGTEPEAVLHAVKVLAAFYTMRPASILADVAITPSGGVLTYSQMPAEVRDFIANWKLGRQLVQI